MKYITLLILSLFSSCLFAQSSDIEKIINEVTSSVVPQEFEYFNLVDSSFILSAESNSFSEINPDLSSFIKDNPDFSLPEILLLFENVEKINWRKYQIDGARLYTYDDIPKFATHFSILREVPFDTPQFILDSLNNNKRYNEVIIPVKNRWSKKRKKEEAEKKWEERFKNTVLENTKYFNFSTPIISLDGKYAIVQLIIGGEGGYTYVFNKKNNKWVVLSQIDGFVY